MRTFADQIEQVGDTITNTSAVKRIGRLARRAVRDAYQDIGSRDRWYYLIKRSQINTVAPYDTGTIQFTESTGEVTLTGGTFPSWAQYGELLINRNVYAVKIMVDSTHLILKSDRMPTADLAAGTGYQLVRTTYDLPADFAEMRILTEIERLWPIPMLPPEEMLMRQRIWFAPSSLLFFSVVGGQNGRMQILIGPAPDQARTYDMIYQGRPRLRTLQDVYKTGTATTTAGSAVVNFTGATLPLNLEGCVLRLGTAKELPTSAMGDFPYVEEHVVLERNSDTQLTLQDSVVGAYSSVMYTLDDPIDLEPLSQLTLFDRMCETRILRIMGSKIDVVAFAERAEKDAWLAALAADERLSSKIMAGMTGFGGFQLRDGFWGVTASEGA